MILKPGASNPLAGLTAELMEIRAEFEPGDASETAFTVRGADIAFDARQQELLVNGHRAPAPLRAGRQRLAIYCDRNALEIFASDGLTYIPMPFIPKPDDLGAAIKAKNGSVRISRLEWHELQSAWR
jgi:fructan beta-fructosidase